MKAVWRIGYAHAHSYAPKAYHVSWAWAFSTKRSTFRRTRAVPVSPHVSPWQRCLLRCMSYRARLICSALTFQPSAGKPGAKEELPSHPLAIIATASNNAPDPGKYGVGTRTPPIGIPTSSNWNKGCNSHSTAFSVSPLRAADMASMGKSQLS